MEMKPEHVRLKRLSARRRRGEVILKLLFTSRVSKSQDDECVLRGRYGGRLFENSSRSSEIFSKLKLEPALQRDVKTQPNKEEH
ncbi:unnamed protein product [Leuciscus chuanchicus]